MTNEQQGIIDYLTTKMTNFIRVFEVVKLTLERVVKFDEI